MSPLPNKQIRLVSPDGSAQVYDLFSAGVSGLTLKITNLAHFHILNVNLLCQELQSQTSSFFSNKTDLGNLWGLFANTVSPSSKETNELQRLEGDKMPSLSEFYYRKKDCFNAQGNTFSDL